MHRLIPALLLPALLGACDRGPEPTPEQAVARREARLAACIAEELQIAAREKLAALESIGGELPEARLRAPHTFAAAYATFADLRAHEAAYMDSAYHAEAAADSTRYERAAASYRLNPPTPGTLEANIAERYLADFASAAGNPAHPCNLMVGEGNGRR